MYAALRLIGWGVLAALFIGQTPPVAPSWTDQINLVVAAAAGLASAGLIGVLKKFEANADTKLVSALGNWTPIVVTILTFLLPKVTTIIGLTNVPDATALASAPVATIIAIAARELLVKLGAVGTAPPASP